MFCWFLEKFSISHCKQTTKRKQNILTFFMPHFCYSLLAWLLLQVAVVVFVLMNDILPFFLFVSFLNNFIALVSLVKKSALVHATQNEIKNLVCIFFANKFAIWVFFFFRCCFLWWHLIRCFFVKLSTFNLIIILLIIIVVNCIVIVIMDSVACLTCSVYLKCVLYSVRTIIVLGNYIQMLLFFVLYILCSCHTTVERKERIEKLNKFLWPLY